MSDSADNTAGKQRRRPFAPGQSGNPTGRPRGIRNKVTVAVEGLMGQYAHQVTARMVKRAVDGDVGAARLILDRVAPIRRGQAVRFQLPDIVDAASVMAAQATLLSEVARGNLTPEEAESVSAMLSTYLKTVETVDIDRRLRELESKSAAQK
jgi:Family of unknown function (DUF5681)